MGEAALILRWHPDDLAVNSTIRAVGDLRKHRLIAFRMPTTGRDGPLGCVEQGRTVTLTIECRFRLNHGEALAEAAVLGAGLARFPRFSPKPTCAAARSLQCRPCVDFLVRIENDSRRRPIINLHGGKQNGCTSTAASPPSRRQPCHFPFSRWP
ncbi:hypothetical protein G3N96_18955 [Burkholderia sp. Se-20373]|nr:hypothetical protein [Burkholderia sp. Se-20373]